MKIVIPKSVAQFFSIEGAAEAQPAPPSGWMPNRGGMDKEFDARIRSIQAERTRYQPFIDLINGHFGQYAKYLGPNYLTNVHFEEVDPGTGKWEFLASFPTWEIPFAGHADIFDPEERAFPELVPDPFKEGEMREVYQQPKYTPNVSSSLSTKLKFTYIEVPGRVRIDYVLELSNERTVMRPPGEPDETTVYASESHRAMQYYGNAEQFKKYAQIPAWFSEALKHTKEKSNPTS
jgi:hypothetical protein